MRKNKKEIQKNEKGKNREAENGRANKKVSEIKWEVKSKKFETEVFPLFLDFSMTPNNWKMSKYSVGSNFESHPLPLSPTLIVHYIT